MPKKTFYNLPAEKKLVLMEALQHEFSQAALADASVANIIQYANIPRGSFYQYFHDKEDAFYYLFDQHVHIAMETFLSKLKKHDGRLFEAMLAFFEVIIEEKKNFHFFKNALLNMNHRMENAFTNIFTDEKRAGHFNAITTIINFQELKLKSHDELLPLMKLLSSVTVHAIIEKFSKELPLDVAVKNYKSQLEFLKKGVIKQ
ncbi:TetR/AcrR family transcriptional regulator [Gracilibacillus xinjiangensis]|uniref:TetR/AcrR family transcriptional regulator n=1 Tax=Gracilibacillus xinjiangensis TaxID=1193282 RepID=A0ABV8WSE0_9BACI